MQYSERLTISTKFIRHCE